MRFAGFVITVTGFGFPSLHKVSVPKLKVACAWLTCWLTLLLLDR